MQFKPKTEKELSEARLLPEGVYPYEVIEASDAKSKKGGHEMIKLKLNIFGRDSSYHVWDYLSGAFMEHKLRHFCVSTGLVSAYEAGTLTARQCLSRQGYAKVVLEDGKDGFDDKNAIDDYVVEETPAPPPELLPTTSTEVPVDAATPKQEPEAVVPEEDNSDIPF